MSLLSFFMLLLEMTRKTMLKCLVDITSAGLHKNTRFSSKDNSLWSLAVDSGFLEVCKEAQILLLS